MPSIVEEEHNRRTNHPAFFYFFSLWLSSPPSFCCAVVAPMVNVPKHTGRGVQASSRGTNRVGNQPWRNSRAIYPHRHAVFCFLDTHSRELT